MPGPARAPPAPAPAPAAAPRRRALRNTLLIVGLLAVGTAVFLWWLLPVEDPGVSVDRTRLAVENAPTAPVGNLTAAPALGPLRIRIPLAIDNPNVLGATLDKVEAELYWNGTVYLGRVETDRRQDVLAEAVSSFIVEYVVEDPATLLARHLRTVESPFGLLPLLPSPFPLTVHGNATVALPLGLGSVVEDFNTTENVTVVPHTPALQIPQGAAVGPGQLTLSASSRGTPLFLWAENRSGTLVPIGVGSPLATAVLTPGNHTLVVFAYDGFSLTPSAPVQVCVRPHTACPVSLPEPPAGAPGASVLPGGNRD